MPENALSLVGLGGNVRPRGPRLKRALELMSSTRGLRLLAVSSFRETPALGWAAQGPFLNAAALVQSSFSAFDLWAELQRIQKACRRVLRGLWREREIDLDLLLHGEERVESPGLRVPHPGLLRRHFALLPAAELLPAARCPGSAGTLVDHLHGLGPATGGF